MVQVHMADSDRRLCDTMTDFFALRDKGTTMKRRELLAFGLAFFVMGGLSLAADKADPAGTWKWTVTRNDNKIDITLKLKYADSKLSGTITGRNNQESAIDDATFKDGEIAFSVTREFNGQKFTTKYKGKLDGDTIKGKADTERDGQTNSRDWEAKRDK